MGFDDNERHTLTSSSHLPNYGGHHLTGEEHAEHGESLREQQTHDREHQHQATTQVWHVKRQLIHFLCRHCNCSNIYDRAHQHRLSWENVLIPAFKVVCEYQFSISMFSRAWEKLQMDWMHPVFPCPMLGPDSKDEKRIYSVFFLYLWWLKWSVPFHDFPA